jgi:Helix-turn-helix domain
MANSLLMNIDVRPVTELHGKNGGTHAALYAPHPELAGCVRAFLSRSTTEAAQLTPEESCNHFPPTPTCVVLWVIRGHDSRVTIEALEQDPETEPMPVVFSGPHSSPSYSQNSRDVHFFTMLIYPDALNALTGVSVEPHLGRYSSFWKLFDSHWQAMARAVFLAKNDAERVQLINEFLRPRWEVVNPKAPVELTLKHADSVAQFSSWSKRVAFSASHRVKNVSERQADRRIKSWTGQNLRQLLLLSRMEAALLVVNKRENASSSNWLKLAIDNGFSDQAHMCREFKRHFGIQPRKIRSSMQNESAWVLRLWS